VGRPPNETELNEAHAAESAKLSRPIAEDGVFPQARRARRVFDRMRAAHPYLTGLTALNIPIPGRLPADWHSFGLANVHSWMWAGTTLRDTSHLIGMTGVYDATEALRRFAPETTEGTLAADYERAVFDLLYHFVMISKPVPNIQARDIDDAVDFGLVKSLIRSADLHTETQETMIDWFRYCD